MSTVPAINLETASTVGPLWPPRLAEVLLAVAVFVAGAWCYNGLGWSQIARYDTIFACVEPGPGQGRFAIDRFLSRPERGVNTGDWARRPAHGPHYYANKAPGPMLLGIPLYAVIYRLERAAGREPETPELTATNCYLLNLLLTVLPLALSSVAFWRLASVWSNGRRGWGLLLTAVLYFGTPLWPFATQLWGHGTAAAFVVLGWYCLQRDTRAGDVWGGWWLGLAVLSEYSTALLLPGWFVFWLWRRQPRRALACLAGGVVPAIAFLAYHRLCFGAFLTIANLHINPVFATGTAAGGLFRGDQLAAAAWGITGSPYRGLFWFAPVTLVLLLGGLVYCRRATAVHWLGLVGCGLFFVMNVTFNGWHGGDSAGPRYLLPALPLLAWLGALPAAAPPAARRWWLGALLLAGAVSVSHMVVCVAVGPVMPEFQPGRPPVWQNPLPEYYRIFYAEGQTQLFGHDALRLTPAGHPAPAPPNAAFNWGQRLGLEGPASLLPLLAILLLLASAMFLSERRQTRRAGRPPRGP